MNLLERWSRVRRLHRQARHAQAQAALQPVFVPRLGFKLAAENREMKIGEFEPVESALLNLLFDDADVFLNIGANIGYYCCMALQRGKRCVAVEPIHENLQLLQRNLSANGWQDGVRIFAAAASDRDGVVAIHGTGTGASLVEGWAGSFDVQFVPALRLDSMLAEDVPGRLLVLMDVEGHELAALRGAGALLARQEPRPTWMVEISIDEHWPGGQRLNPGLVETFEQFWAAGYRAYTADATLREVTRDEVVQVSDTRRNTLSTHNFLFTDRAEFALAALRERLTVA